MTVGGEKIRIFGFAKQGKGKSPGSLTARNYNGAVLLSQVLGQIDKTTFDTALIISSSTINEDLRERIKMVCGVFGRKILIVDGPVLERMLLFYEEQAEFEGIDVDAVYKASSTK